MNHDLQNNVWVRLGCVSRQLGRAAHTFSQTRACPWFACSSETAFELAFVWGPGVSQNFACLWAVPAVTMDLPFAVSRLDLTDRQFGGYIENEAACADNIQGKTLLKAPHTVCYQSIVYFICGQLVSRPRLLQ